MQQFLIEADSNEVTKYLEQELLEEVFEEYGVILTGQEVRFAAALRKKSCHVLCTTEMLV